MRDTPVTGRTATELSRWALTGTLLLGCLAISTAPSARADATDTYRAAKDATRAAIATTGVDIVVLSTSNRARTVPGAAGNIAARTTLRYHFAGNPAGESYTSLRNARTRRLLAAWGTNATDGEWATITSMDPAWSSIFARSRALAMTTSVTALDGRLWSVPGVEESLSLAMTQLVPPLDWIGWRQGTQPDGSTVLFASSGEGWTSGDPDDSCVYGPLRLVIRDGVIRSSRYAKRCPGGSTTSFTGTVQVRATVDESTAPRISQSAAFAQPTQPVVASWQQIANAANTTAATQFTSVTTTSRSGNPVRNAGVNNLNADTSVVTGLAFVDDLMRYGNPGVPQPMGGPSAGDIAYLISARLGQPYLARSPNGDILSVSIIIKADGVISSITSVTNAPDTFVSTFTRS